jgi:hypothetical protein
MRSICLLQQLLGGKVRSPEYHEANDPETEIWRACQRSSTTELLVMSAPDRVYIVDRTRRILTSVVLRFPGPGSV